ncbi:hypothetical protein [Mycobacteroides abscessus]|uniref:hypothetical protein n=1 Tax=Mycobacteroides abscessus TaxID=36809 RepID=UPI000929F694|nr:hypothetical protein [Mycobacteroides abscessus]SHV73170.1 Uncharacterised protein [Mycobacteroides abscessus subsp. abscessus]SHW31818.1 Uncharacterised protein [Mycobacteroides abscessus subsp. abscessus]SHW40430.1 Uncharacterised protein [Mycobacteroides abscessus subsp. abscessus]SHW67158.1 Uncharacterised protein [Mycobacteroides abscessus subsp. abscessus]SHX17857.1 Uncharacterised protein [Mycobacteroides abscessus subsp. abscessus]
MDDLEGQLAAIRSRYEREHAANRLVVMRSGVTQADLMTTVRTLRGLGAVNLDDLKVPPGFDLLPEGDVANVNPETVEWQDWATAQRLIDQSAHLSERLNDAESELVLARHWSSEDS